MARHHDRASGEKNKGFRREDRTPTLITPRQITVLRRMLRRRKEELDHRLRASWGEDTVGLETLRSIDDALQRMREGTYGRCEECGNAIPYARLEVLPSASLCVTCKAREERGMGSGGYDSSRDLRRLQDNSYYLSDDMDASDSMVGSSVRPLKRYRVEDSGGGESE